MCDLLGVVLLAVFWGGLTVGLILFVLVCLFWVICLWLVAWFWVDGFDGFGLVLDCCC